MKYETRIVTLEEANAFLQNMHWFCGVGRISVKQAETPGKVIVKATRSAWSYWVPFSKEESRVQ